MFEFGKRNTWITIITEILIFMIWGLGSYFGWPDVEWAVGAITAAVAASALRARGEYLMRSAVSGETVATGVGDQAVIAAEPKTDVPI